MVYYKTEYIKKYFDILPSDDSVNETLRLHGAEADAWVDSVMGNGTTLSTVPEQVKHISSKYAAGGYLAAKENPRGKELQAQALEDLKQYIKGVGHVVVFG